MKSAIGPLPIYQVDLILSFLLIALLEVVHLIQLKHNMYDLLRRKPVYIRWTFYYLVLMVIIFFGVYEKRQFIYFQF
jgi:hypothetical protein